MSSPLPNTISSIEAAILTSLGTAIGAQILVEAFPDDPDTYRVRHPVGAVLVAFGRARYSEPEATDVVVQDQRLEWDITLLIRNLRTHTGAYTYLDAVRIALTGLRVMGCTKLYCTDQRFLAQGDGIWKYAMRFAHATTVVQVEVDQTLPLLQRLTMSLTAPKTETVEVDS